VPAPIVAKLNSELNAILRDPEMSKRLTAEAAEPTTTTPEAFGKLVVDDIGKWGRVAKQAGIRGE
jgi:tripartite-type tricarboxylate transporter receptor subunit TctC